VAAGPYWSFGLRADGTMWFWGDGCDDEGLGHGSAPAKVGTDTDWRSIDAGSSYEGYPLIIATKTDGTLWRAERVWPNPPGVGQVGDDAGWASAERWGVSTAVGTKTNGTLWTWAVNNDTFTQVGTSNKWVAVTSGTGFTLAIARP
jgi:hypothetical protein